MYNNIIYKTHTYIYSFQMKSLIKYMICNISGELLWFLATIPCWVGPCFSFPDSEILTSKCGRRNWLENHHLANAMVEIVSSENPKQVLKLVGRVYTRNGTFLVLKYPPYRILPGKGTITTLHWGNLAGSIYIKWATLISTILGRADVVHPSYKALRKIQPVFCGIFTPNAYPGWNGEDTSRKAK